MAILLLFGIFIFELSAYLTVAKLYYFFVKVHKKKSKYRKIDQFVLLL